jgi:hypothetical protein
MGIDVGVDGDCLGALLACVADNRADASSRKLAAAILEAVAAGDCGSAALPGQGEFSAALVIKLASLVAEPSMGGRAQTHDNILNGPQVSESAAKAGAAEAAADHRLTSPSWAAP